MSALYNGTAKLTRLTKLSTIINEVKIKRFFVASVPPKRNESMNIKPTTAIPKPKSRETLKDSLTSLHLSSIDLTWPLTVLCSNLFSSRINKQTKTEKIVATIAARPIYGLTAVRNIEKIVKAIAAVPIEIKPVEMAKVDLYLTQR